MVQSRLKGKAGDASKYDNQLRADRAAESRVRIVESARVVLLERDFTAMTIRAIAERADVSVETIYKTFGGKAGLVKAMWDATLVGDFQPLSIAERPAARSIGQETDPVAKIGLYAKLAADLHRRIGPLVAATRGVNGSDTALAQLTEATNRERLAGTGMLVDHLIATRSLRRGLVRDVARDITWTYTSPEMYLLLIHDRGWSYNQYENWLATALVAALT